MTSHRNPTTQDCLYGSFIFTKEGFTMRSPITQNKMASKK